MLRTSTSSGRETINSRPPRIYRLRTMLLWPFILWVLPSLFSDSRLLRLLQGYYGDSEKPGCIASACFCGSPYLVGCRFTMHTGFSILIGALLRYLGLQSSLRVSANQSCSDLTRGCLGCLSQSSSDVSWICERRRLRIPILFRLCSM